MKCSIDDCDREEYCRGWCDMHYHRWYRNGTTDRLLQDHGMHKTPTYRSWADMLNRCENPRHKSYKDYGGRGIKVCNRWTWFLNFLNDMGIKPEGKSLDRIDNDGNYEPSNCRWATPKEQSHNRRNSIIRT
jgi:hypothetical protein